MRFPRAQEVCSRFSAKGGVIGAIARRACYYCCSGLEYAGKTVAWMALLVSSGFAQSAPQASNSVPGNQPVQNVNAAQQMQVTNPFATPWQMPSAEIQNQITSNAAAAVAPLKPTKHVVLTPSPELLESESVPPADPVTLSGLGFSGRGMSEGLSASYSAGVQAQQARNSISTNDDGRGLDSGFKSHFDASQLMPSADAHTLASVPKKYDVGHIGDRGVGGGMNFYSTEKEIELGKQLSQQVEQQAKLFTDPVVNEYVNRIAQNLARNSDAKVPFKVKIIDSDEINAFALPGGFFYVNVGLLLAAENEAELAGVMAHEIGHVAARHATKTQTKKDIWDLASLPLVMVGGPAGMAVRNLMGVAVPMTFLKFSRDAEREADLLGVEYQYAAGYDPAAMVTFFEKLSVQEKRKHGIVSSAFSTHPMNEDRIQRAQKTIATMLPAKEEYLDTTSDFDQMKSRLLNLTTGKRDMQMAGVKRPTLRKTEDERPTLKRQ